MRGPWWWAKLLAANRGLYSALCPWPFGRGLARLRDNRELADDSPGMSAALAIACLSTWYPPPVADPQASHELMANFAFALWAVVAGMLSLAGGLPDAGLLKRALRRHPANFPDHVRPWLLALVAGVATVAAPLVWIPFGVPGWPWLARFVLAFLGWRGAFALVGAVMYGLRL